MTIGSEQIQRLSRTADDLAALLAGKAPSILVRRPAENAWAATEVVCHLRDTEELFQYLRNDALEALASFRARREETLKLLRALAQEQWQRGGIHASRGRMTVKDFVALIASHDDNHLDQLRRALDGRP